MADLGKLNNLNNFKASDVLSKNGAGRPLEIDIDQITEDASQPRESMNEEALRELSDSIRSIGIQQPVLLKKTDGGYQIIAGHRRFRAARMAGKATIPAFVDDIEADEARQLTRQMAENIHRENLNPFEIAHALQKFVDLGHKQKDLTGIVSKSKQWISDHLILLELPEHLKELFYSGKCKGVTALLALHRVPEDQQAALIERLEGESEITVSDAKKIVKQLSGEDGGQDSTSDSTSSGGGGDNSGGDGGADGGNSGLDKMGDDLLKEDKFKKPTFVVSNSEGLEAQVIMKKKPSYEGAVWIKYDHDGGEEETDINSLSFVMLREGA